MCSAPTQLGHPPPLHCRPSTHARSSTNWLPVAFGMHSVSSSMSRPQCDDGENTKRDGEGRLQCDLIWLHLATCHDSLGCHGRKHGTHDRHNLCRRFGRASVLSRLPRAGNRAQALLRVGRPRELGCYRCFPVIAACSDLVTSWAICLPSGSASFRSQSPPTGARLGGVPGSRAAIKADISTGFTR